MANWINVSHYSLFLFLAAGLGLFQGLVWSILSFIAIIFHFSTKSRMYVVYQNEPFQETLKAYMYYAFIKSNGKSNGMLIQPAVFMGFMMIYFFFSLAWIASSVYVIYSFRKKFTNQRLFYGVFAWVAIVVMTSLLDFVFCCILGADYNTAVTAFNKTLDNFTLRVAYSYSITSYGIMMIIATRGFALWIINVVLAAVMGTLCYQLRNSHDLSNRNENIFNTLNLPRDRIHVQNLPDEVRNQQIYGDPRRRQTLPPLMSPGGISASSSFQFNRDLLHNYDPEVERRLEKYDVVPEYNKFRKLF